MMALTLGTLEICVRALQTRESSYIARLARFSFMLEVCDLQETAGRVTALESSRQGGRIQSRRACDGTGALHDSEEGSGAMIYMAAPESSLAEKQGPEPLDTCQPQSLHLQRQSPIL
jgi:hypothetical protein